MHFNFPMILTANSHADVDLAFPDNVVADSQKIHVSAIGMYQHYFFSLVLRREIKSYMFSFVHREDCNQSVQSNQCHIFPMKKHWTLGYP